MNLSYAPRSDYLANIAALSPFDLIVGQDDEFLIAKTFCPVLESATDAGAYHMVQGRGHLDVLFEPETLQIITRHLEAGSYKWTPTKFLKQWMAQMMGFDLLGTATDHT